MTVNIMYRCEGEQPFVGDLHELLGNFVSSGAVGPGRDFEWADLEDIVEAIDKQGVYIGSHGHGRFAIMLPVVLPRSERAVHDAMLAVAGAKDPFAATSAPAVAESGTPAAAVRLFDVAAHRPDGRLLEIRKRLTWEQVNPVKRTLRHKHPGLNTEITHRDHEPEDDPLRPIDLLDELVNSDFWKAVKEAEAENVPLDYSGADVIDWLCDTIMPRAEAMVNGDAELLAKS